MHDGLYSINHIFNNRSCNVGIVISLTHTMIRQEFHHDPDAPKGFERVGRYSHWGYLRDNRNLTAR